MGPKGGLLGQVRALATEVRRLKLGVHAAGTCFYLVLSLFPGLVLLLGLLRSTRFTAAHLVALLEGMLPAALLPEAELLIGELYRSAPASLVGLSAVTALWSASRGIQGLITGLKAVYDLPAEGGWVYARLRSLLYTFGFLPVLLLTLMLHVFGTGLIAFLRSRASPFWQFVLQLVDLRFFLLLGLQTALFTGLFAALHGRGARLSECLPGAFLASSGWLIFSQIYSLYVENTSGYQTLYGSLWWAAVGMLWLYFCIYILFFGGLLNKYLAKK